MPNFYHYQFKTSDNVQFDYPDTGKLNILSGPQQTVIEFPNGDAIYQFIAQGVVNVFSSFELEIKPR